MDSIRGYDWQRWLTLEQWLGLTGEDRLWIEWGEDITVARESGIDTIQAKDLTSKVSLGQEKIQKIISSALTRAEGVRTVLWTSGAIGTERSDPFGEPGIKYWKRVVHGGGEPAKLRDFLVRAKKLTEAARKALSDAPEAHLPALFGKVSWIVDEVDLNLLRARIEPQIETRLVNLGITNASELRGLYADTLFALVARAAIQPVVDDRLLTRADLDAVARQLYGSFLDAGRPEIVGKVIGLVQDQLAGLASEWVDDKIELELNRLRQSRFIVGHNTEREAETLAQRILNGNLRNGSGRAKGVALSWVSRLLVEASLERRQELQIAAESWTSGEVLEINRAFLTATRDGSGPALAALSAFPTPAARSASVMVIGNAGGYSDVAEWLAASGVGFADLDVDGKYYLLSQALTADNWDDAAGFYERVLPDDLAQAPVLTYLGGLVCLARAARRDLRPILLNGLPQDLIGFPLNDDIAGMETRREAAGLFEQCEGQCRALELDGTADISADFSLWLRLLDPETNEAALKMLEDSLSETAIGLRRIDMALAFGIDIDLDAVRREAERQLVLTGYTSREAIHALMAVAAHAMTPEAFADYIADNRDRFEKVYGAELLTLREAHALAAGGLADRLDGALMRLAALGVDERALEPLRHRMAELGGADPVAVRKAAYNSDPSLQNLHILLLALLARKDFRQAAKYARLYFDAVTSVAACEMLADCLDRIGHDRDLFQVLADHPALVAQTVSLQWAWCLALYRKGRLEEALSVLNTLRSAADQPPFWGMAAEIAKVSGEWEALNDLVETAWRERAQLEPSEYFFAARLAKEMGSARLVDLLRHVVSRFPDDAAVLLSAYQMAVQAGTESEESDAWFIRAVELFGADGPIRKATLGEVVEMQTERLERRREARSSLRDGKVPMFAAAAMTYNSLGTYYLLPALYNASVKDVREKLTLYTYSGKRSLQPMSGRRIGIEGVALLTLELLGLTDVVVSEFDAVCLPHATLGWLYEERARIQFHQPKQLQVARQVRNLVAERKLAYFTSTVHAPLTLSSEVGVDLAEMLTDAASPGAAGCRRVLLTAPVLRAGSLSAEAANLSGFEHVVVSCAAIVDRFVATAQLTQAEAEKAYAYLDANVPRWPKERALQARTTVYLDGSSLLHLLHLGLLGKLGAVGITAYVAPDESRDLSLLLQQGSRVEAATALIDGLRRRLGAHLRSGKVLLGERPREKLRQDEVDDGFLNSRYRVHPTVSVIDVVKDVEGVVVDDRFLNEHLNMQSREKLSVPLYTTIDLLALLRDRGRLSQTQYVHCLTKLRGHGYMFVPVTPDEVHLAVEGSKMVGETFVPSAELQALHDNMLQARCESSLLLPEEGTWIGQAIEAVVGEIKLQWVSGGSLKDVRARSEWLLQMADLRDWAGCFREGFGGHMPELAPLHVLSLLQPDPTLKPEAKAQYRQWLTEDVLKPMKESDPRAYRRLLENIDSTLRQSLVALLETADVPA